MAGTCFTAHEAPDTGMAIRNSRFFLPVESFILRKLTAANSSWKIERMPPAAKPASAYESEGRFGDSIRTSRLVAYSGFCGRQLLAQRREGGCQYRAMPGNNIGANGASRRRLPQFDG